MMLQKFLLTLGVLCCTAGTALADETAFLDSLEGKWTGSGMVLTRINRAPINVSCNFDSEADGSALSMKGTCRGLLVISRSISADLRSKGATYSGVYVGPRGGRSALTGSRRGNAINLTIRWAREVNGDRRARLVVQKVGENGMRLSTIDEDPSSGKRVVTSEINLRRT
ncbi:hypothetical protein AU381_19130 [Sinorhizobium glycinis]|uniref:Uncharacterized protein n=1 Tax=Sinorhizobium glycinis TaxID=1472378 RepID=A0A178XN28_9HYPH|nr:hypothetical protein [Sinorhizobium glycinis]OAP36604.1 hypothetical protein AU381_19130 [Sinorhizobium glycinis]